MDANDIIIILAKHIPGMTVSSAISVANDIVSVAYLDKANARNEDDVKRQTDNDTLIKASIWAFAELGCNDVEYHKIKSIQRIRSEFPGTGIRQAKAIIDSLAERWAPEPNPYPEDEDPLFGSDVRIVDNGEGFTYVPE